jgi:tRNA-specific 2-thiouridylase
MMNKPKVLLGMSGGVDSSVSAVLLLEQGFEVIGGFMKNWSDEQCEEGEFAECSWRTERRDAMRVAAQLNIPFVTFDFEKQYRAQIYEYMLAEYQAGRTPNPDVLCNKYMKFGLFLAEAEKLGCDFVATGHYARIHVDDDRQAHLLAGIDSNKDQSYFLCQLTQDQLRRAIFPIGHLLKSEVRDIARKNNLPVAEKKDSQGICFVGKVEMVDFLKRRIPERTGNIVTTSGEVIGEHKGYMYYTVGQREGLGVGGGQAYYVVERRPETNEVIVAVGDDDPKLYSTTLVAVSLSDNIPGALNTIINQPIEARIRYRQPLAKCVIEQIDGDQARVRFLEPQRAVAPGQFIAFHRGDEVLGSGIIDSAT